MFRAVVKSLLTVLMVSSPFMLLGANADLDKRLSEAVRKGQTKKVAELLANGANPNATREDGVAVLLAAAHDGLTDIAELLIEKGARLDATTAAGASPLILAAGGGKRRTVELLLAKGAVVDFKSKNGVTASMLAASYGHTEIVELLLDHRAEVNATNEDGVTPLMMAAFDGKLNLVQVLVGRGADLKAADRNGDTPLTYALKNGKNAVAKYIEQAIKPLEQQLADAIAKGQTEVVAALLGKGVDVNLRLADGHRFLTIAARHGRTDIAELLLERGADINGQDVNGTTPLMWATAEGRDDLSRLLIEKLADVDARNDSMSTALMIAAINGRQRIVEFLVNAGADASAFNNVGGTALQLAESGGHRSVAAYLLGQVAPVVAGRNYAVLKVLSTEDSEWVERGDKQWPDLEAMTMETRERLREQLVPAAQTLGADDVVVVEGRTVNIVDSALGLAIAAGLYEGLSQAKYERTAPRLPGGGTASPPVDPPAPLPGSKAPRPPGRSGVERQHKLVAFAVKYQQPGSNKAPPTREELSLWRMAQRTDVAQPYRLYLRKFPNGSFADLARAKVPLVEQVAVWIYRPSKDFRRTIYVNGEPVVRIGPQTYIKVMLDIGKTEFQTYSNIKSLVVELAPGREYYLRSFDVRLGTTERLEMSDPEEAKLEISKMKHLEPRFIVDPSRVIY